MTEKAAHIRIQNLTMAYGNFVVMRDLNFAIDHGDTSTVRHGL